MSALGHVGHGGSTAAALLGLGLLLPPRASSAYFVSSGRRNRRLGAGRHDRGRRAVPAMARARAARWIVRLSLKLRAESRTQRQSQGASAHVKATGSARRCDHQRALNQSQSSVFGPRDR